MNITYILGNGFDIQLGLKSRYSDFLAEYVKPKSGDTINIRKFKRYLRERPNCEWWSDAEKAMGKDLGRFSDRTIEIYREQLINFQDELASYLEKQESICDFSEEGQLRKRFIEFLIESFNGIEDVTYRRTPLPNIEFRFISFNYTSLIDKLLKCCMENGGVSIYKGTEYTTRQDKLGMLCHVHGDLNSQIIMGVNDESQLVMNHELTLNNEIRWQFLKGEMSRALRWKRDRTAKSLIERSNIIVMYGVSYGETDAQWWEEVVKWLESDTRHRIVAFIYEENSDMHSRVPCIRINYEKEKKKEILKRFGVSENSIYFEMLEKQIYIEDATKDLNLRELIRPEEAIAAMNATNKNEV